MDGYIEKWLFRPGQQVQAGPAALYSRFATVPGAGRTGAGHPSRQAEADLSFAKQQVSLLQAEANLEAAKANLVKAQQDFERLKPLVEQDAAAQQDLDAAVAALRAAEANVRANEANVEQARLNTETQVQSTEGTVQQQRGALETADLNLQYGTIRAPISGRVGDTLAPVGGLVTANSAQPLTTIVPLDPIWVRFKVSEVAVSGVSMRLKHSAKGAGPPLELFLADNTNFLMPGEIENSLNQVDPRTGTLEVAGRDSLIRSTCCCPDSLAGSAL